MNCFQDNAPRRWAWRAEKSPMKTSRRVLCTIPVSDRNMPGKRTIVSRNYRQVGRLFRGNEYPAFVIIESVYRHSGFLLSFYQTFSIENSNSSHFLSNSPQQLQILLSKFIISYPCFFYTILFYCTFLFFHVITVIKSVWLDVFLLNLECIFEAVCLKM